MIKFAHQSKLIFFIFLGTAQMRTSEEVSPVVRRCKDAKGVQKEGENASKAEYKVETLQAAISKISSSVVKPRTPIGNSGEDQFSRRIT